MKKLLSSLIQSGALATGLVCCGTPVLAQEPGFPPETSAPPPEQGPGGGHRGMMDPAQQLAGMTKRYNLSADQQDKVKPILLFQQHQMQALRGNSLLSGEDRMAKMQSIRSDSNTKIKAVLNDDQKKQFEQDQLRMQQQGQGDGSKGGTPPR